MPNILKKEQSPKGKVEHRRFESSHIYPGTKRDYWIYIPSQYQDTSPACLMVFQDGEAYVNDDGPVKAAKIFDDLIHNEEMPITIGIFVSPGLINQTSTRADEYVATGDVYARFLLEEIIPEVSKDYRLVNDRDGRAICGMSDGGLCAFAVAWQRTDIFSKVICHIASFARHIEGADFPHLVRKTRNSPKPLRVFLADGKNDLNLDEGNWTLGNLSMASALQFSKYDYRLELGPGGHDLTHGGKLFPETLRWLWRDYPGVKNALPAYEEILGEWEMTTNFYGTLTKTRLFISKKNGLLSGTLQDETKGEIAIRDITYQGRSLKYSHTPFPFQAKWGKGVTRTMLALLRFDEGKLKGTLSGICETDTSYDYALSGARNP